MKLSGAQTRSITAENVYGERGRGGMAEVSETPQPEVVRIGQKWEPSQVASDLGRGWKVRPSITLPAETVTTLMDVDGPGIIQHIWCTVDPKRLRHLILRMYWDNEETPSVEVPLGDFFCNGWRIGDDWKPVNIFSLPINVNPSGGFNSFFPMPFRQHARITIENISTCDQPAFYYTINYALCDIAQDDAYFHAQFRRVNPLPYKEDYVIIDGVKGQGHYVGTYMAWQQNNWGWWGEGELKVYLDGDREFPTICGTGTEDYFGGAWAFIDTFSAPFMGYPMGSPLADKVPQGTRHSVYRFHIMDPIRFQSDIKVTIQALGWRRGPWRYLPLQDDIASVAYWYQSEPHAPFPSLPDRDYLEVI